MTVTGQADTRELMVTKTVNKTIYSIYKKILDESDYRTNPDGWKCYRSELILDIIKEGKTESYVVDNNIYLDKQDSHHGGQQPCMLQLQGIWLHLPDGRLLLLYLHGRYQLLEGDGL